MTMKKTILIITALLAFLSMNGQGVAFVNINPDPASSALAATGVARSADAFAVENNIAAAALSPQRMAASVGYGIWQPRAIDAKMYSAAGFYRPTERLAVALQFKGIAYPAYSIVSEDGRAVGSFSPRELTAGLGLAYSIVDCFAAGVNLRFISSSLAGDSKGSSVAADIAVKYERDAFQAGFSLCNFGSPVRYGNVKYTLPMSARVGAAYSVIGLTLSAEADCFLKGGLAAGVGAEYTFFDTVSLRAGYHYGNSTGALASFASAGLGLNLKGVRLDFAWLAASEALRNTMLFSLGYAF